MIRGSEMTTAEALGGIRRHYDPAAHAELAPLIAEMEYA